ncbi:MAG: hypothetical protein P8N28_05500 [Phycisphaerales bacterium]|nr:hypothetical protein [Phycisphaerales bacterium]
MARRKQNKFKVALQTSSSLFLDVLKSPVLISWVLAIGGLITLTAMSVPKLRATRVSAAEIKVTFNAPPVWLNNSLLIELQNVARAHLAQTTVGRDGLVKTAEAIAATGWFTEVKQVQWLSDQHARVEATFLVPYAKVTDQKGDLYIDSQGRRLPQRDGVIVNPKYHFIALTNPTNQRPQIACTPWAGDDIYAALKVLHVIYQEKAWVTQIQSIDLGAWNHSGTMTFVTNTPSRFNWGSPPNEERQLETLASEKLHRLNWLNENFGSIDKGMSKNFDLTNTASITFQ